MADMPAAQRTPDAEKMMAQMFDSMNISIDLKADGTAAYSAKMMGQDESATGTWKLDGTKLSMTTKDKAGKEETKTGDYANGVLTLEEDMGGKKMKMTFKRK